MTTTPQGLTTSPCPLFVTELFCAPSLNRQAFIVVQWCAFQSTNDVDVHYTANIAVKWLQSVHVYSQPVK